MHVTRRDLGFAQLLGAGDSDGRASLAALDRLPSIRETKPKQLSVDPTLGADLR